MGSTDTIVFREYRYWLIINPDTVTTLRFQCSIGISNYQFSLFRMEILFKDTSFETQKMSRAYFRLPSRDCKDAYCLA